MLVWGFHLGEVAVKLGATFFQVSQSSDSKV